MKADVYYPIITQTEYGQPSKQWVLDRTFICSATPPTGSREDVKAEVFIQYDDKLIARAKTDLRISSNLDNNALTNILITNIRTATDELVYKETAGPRNGKGTIFEVATLQPFLNPFGTIEYYNMVWRRTENQSVGD
jgi:hypothetical protein